MISDLDMEQANYLLQDHHKPFSSLSAFWNLFWDANNSREINCFDLETSAKPLSGFLYIPLYRHVSCLANLIRESGLFAANKSFLRRHLFLIDDASDFYRDQSYDSWRGLTYGLQIEFSGMNSDQMMMVSYLEIQ